jgi:hypothetical protein
MHSAILAECLVLGIGKRNKDVFYHRHSAKRATARNETCSAVIALERTALCELRTMVGWLIEGSSWCVDERAARASI